MLRFRISNMSCGGCAKGVAAALREGGPIAQTMFGLNAREVPVATALTDADRFDAALRASGWKFERLPG
mgnify:CR=1 FL=1